MDRSTKQKINKETQTLNDTIDQLDQIDIYRTFHPKTMNFFLFFKAPEILSSFTFPSALHPPPQNISLYPDCISVCI